MIVSRDDIVENGNSPAILRSDALRRIGVLSIEHVRPTTPDTLYRRFPVPWVTLVISLGVRGWWRASYDEWERFPAVTIRGHGGPWSFGRDEAGAAEYIKVLIDPCQMSRTLIVPAAEIAGGNYDATGVAELRAVFNRDELASIADIRRRLDLVATGLLALSRQTVCSPDRFDIADMVNATKVSKLANLSGMSARGFRSRVHRVTGLSPKHWSRLSRFAAALRTLHSEATDAAVSGGVDCYFDQSHLIHEFRHFTGTTPAKYKHVKALGDPRAYMMAELGAVDSRCALSMPADR